MLSAKTAINSKLASPVEARAQTEPVAAAQAKDFQTKTFKSSDLFGPYKAILIMHDSEQYQLRLTRQNKLILTK